jgi:DNA-binding XRE family transcriptional regulator
MSSKKKIVLTNLADLRADLGLKLADMAAAIKPMTRQTLGAIENGEAKDAIFMHALFTRMRAAFAARFEVFDFIEAPDRPGCYLIRYKANPSPIASPIASPEAVEHEFERLSFQIMDLNNKLRRGMKGDGALLCRQEPYLRELLETLYEHFEREKAA